MIWMRKVDCRGDARTIRLSRGHKAPSIFVVRKAPHSIFLSFLVWVVTKQMTRSLSRSPRYSRRGLLRALLLLYVPHGEGRCASALSHERGVTMHGPDSATILTASTSVSTSAALGRTTKMPRLHTRPVPVRRRRCRVSEMSGRQAPLRHRSSD